jgi:IS1 family transposase
LILGFSVKSHINDCFDATVPQLDFGHFSSWLWVALCRRTRQVVAYTLGDRTRESAFFLREAFPEGYRRRATRSDFWEPYGIAFPVRTRLLLRQRRG